MTRHEFIIAAAFGLAAAAPAAAQLHAAQTEPLPAIGNPAPALKEPAPAATLPDASKVVTKGDAQKFAEAEFAFADADKNMKLSRAEFVAIDTARKDEAVGAKVTAPAPTSAAKDAGAALKATPSAGNSPDAQFSDLAGKETQVTKQVFIDSRLKAFAKADADVNGSLSAVEAAKFADIIAGKTVM